MLKANPFLVNDDFCLGIDSPFRSTWCALWGLRYNNFHLLYLFSAFKESRGQALRDPLGDKKSFNLKIQLKWVPGEPVPVLPVYMQMFKLLSLAVLSDVFKQSAGIFMQHAADESLAGNAFTGCFALQCKKVIF